MDELPKEVSSYVILGALVKNLTFRDGASGHFGFGPPAKNANIFERDRGAKSLLNGP